MLPTHLSRKFFSLTTGDAGFARQALDQVRFAGPDRSANQIALGQGGEVVLLPERDVLPQPGFHFVLAVQVVEGAGGLDEFDQAVAVVLDQVLFHFDKVGGLQARALACCLDFEQALDGAERGAGRVAEATSSRLPGKLAEGDRERQAPSTSNAARISAAPGSGNLDFRGARVVGKQGMQVV